MSTEDQALRATCQICGRSIKWKNGKIAHHGYKRPGEGWQTGSCEGAREMPLHMSRYVLGRHVEAFKGITQRSFEAISAPVTEKIYTVKHRKSAWHEYTFENHKVTEENFAEMYKQFSRQFLSCIYSWADIVKGVVWTRTLTHKRNAEYLKYQSERLQAAIETYGE